MVKTTYNSYNNNDFTLESVKPLENLTSKDIYAINIAISQAHNNNELIHRIGAYLKGQKC